MTVTDMETTYLSHEEIQAELLDMLVYLADFLDGHGLRYSLFGGTLLGAIRHKGFIPWDDDIDICMPRPDYEQLKGIADDLRDPFRLVDNRITKGADQFMKFWNTGIRAQEPVYIDVMEEYLWIDIMPMDGMPDDDEERKRFFNRLWSLKYQRRWMTHNPDVSASLPRKMFKKAFRTIMPESRKELLDNRIQAALITYPYIQADHIACYASGSKVPWEVSKAEFEDFIEVDFEGHAFSAMGCYDHFMKQVYGDYMEIPPEEKQITHDLKVWRVQ